jgi:hypothetical protein
VTEIPRIYLWTIPSPEYAVCPEGKVLSVAVCVGFWVVVTSLIVVFSSSLGFWVVDT